MQDAYTTIIDNIRWIDDEKGAIKIFREPLIKTENGSRSDGVPYVMGCDTAGDGSDFFAAHVIDNINGSQVAVYHMDKVDEDLFADQIYCLGKYYNDALIGVETNFSTLTTRKLAEMQYPNMYMRESVDNITKQVQKKYGFVTSVKTRPLIINNLVEIARENITNINDITTLREMLTFIRNEKGRAEAEIGKHDDLVMSLAITYFISNQQVGFKKEEMEPRDDVMSSFFKFRQNDEEGGYIEW
jgi:phage terminase large subunit